MPESTPQSTPPTPTPSSSTERAEALIKAGYSDVDGLLADGYKTVITEEGKHPKSVALFLLVLGFIAGVGAATIFHF